MLAGNFSVSDEVDDQGDEDDDGEDGDDGYVFGGDGDCWGLLDAVG